MEISESFKFSRMTIPELEEELRKRDAQIKEQAARIKDLERDIEELKRLLGEKAKSKEAKAPKGASNYSVDRYERKRRKKSAVARSRPAGSRRP